MHFGVDRQGFIAVFLLFFLLLFHKMEKNKVQWLKLLIKQSNQDTTDVIRPSMTLSVKFVYGHTEAFMEISRSRGNYITDQGI